MNRPKTARAKGVRKPEQSKAGDIFSFADDLGPEKVIHIHRPTIGLRAILVIDNVAAGPAIGGTRMAPDVGLDECFRLARAMTFKNAVAGLRHGGAKSAIIADPAMPSDRKEEIIRAFAQSVGEVTDYIDGTDMGTNETAMAWIADEIGRSVGLPREIGGIPLDQIGVTGFGLTVAAEVAEEFSNVKLDGARIVLQGFGAVGQHAARFLCEKGCVLVGASDSRGAVADPQGIEVVELIRIKEEGGQVADYPRGEKLDRDAVIDVACDIWIPAARPDVINVGDVDRLDCKMVLQGANIPVTPEAEVRLFERGILSIPDFVANAGGVICGAVEYAGGTQANAFTIIEQKIRDNVHAVLAESRASGERPRIAAVRLAEVRVRRAMSWRRWR